MQLITFLHSGIYARTPVQLLVNGNNYSANHMAETQYI